MDFLQNFWRNNQKVTIAAIVIVIGVLVWFFVLKKKHDSSKKLVAEEAPMTGGVIDHFIKDYPEMYNKDLSYVNIATGKPTFPYANATFMRETGSNKGSVKWTGTPLKSGTWVDSPTVQDLSVKIPITQSDIRTHQLVGDLILKLDSSPAPVVFRKDAEGIITVTDGLTLGDAPGYNITEQTYRLAVLK